jgi:hypothetical protein
MTAGRFTALSFHLRAFAPSLLIPWPHFAAGRRETSLPVAQPIAMLHPLAPLDDLLSTIIVNAAFDPAVWSAVPFHFWSVVFFVFGSTVGSFLSVCIHRLPLGQSVVAPASHCPACNYAIPWYLNIPLLTWIYLAACRT